MVTDVSKKHVAFIFVDLELSFNSKEPRNGVDSVPEMQCFCFEQGMTDKVIRKVNDFKSGIPS